MDQFYAALQRAAIYEMSGQRAAMQQYIDKMQRENEEKRKVLVEKVIGLLAEAKAEPDPIPEVVAAYTKILARLKDPSS